MIQTCNEEYWKDMEWLKQPEAPCGKTFDDLDHLTYCPHAYFDAYSLPSRDWKSSNED